MIRQTVTKNPRKREKKPQPPLQFHGKCAIGLRAIKLYYSLSPSLLLNLTRKQIRSRHLHQQPALGPTYSRRTHEIQ